MFVGKKASIFAFTWLSYFFHASLVHSSIFRKHKFKLCMQIYSPHNLMLLLFTNCPWAIQTSTKINDEDIHFAFLNFMFHLLLAFSWKIEIFYLECCWAMEISISVDQIDKFYHSKQDSIVISFSMTLTYLSRKFGVLRQATTVSKYRRDCEESFCSLCSRYRAHLRVQEREKQIAMEMFVLRVLLCFVIDPIDGILLSALLNAISRPLKEKRKTEVHKLSE